MRRQGDRTGNGVPGSKGESALAPGSVEARVEIFRSMVELCAVAMFAIDTEHRVIHWNRACVELTGLDAEAILGTSDHWRPFYDFQRPTLSDLLIDGQEEAMQQHYQVYGSSVLMPYSLHAQGWYPRVGGRERYLIFDASPVFNRDGSLMAASRPSRTSPS
jgi:PAS domain-containing protein